MYYLLSNTEEVKITTDNINVNRNYIRYKEDLKQSMPSNKPYSFYNRNELIIKFMPLVENISQCI